MSPVCQFCTIYVAPVYRYPEGDSKTPTSHGPYIFFTLVEEFLHYQRNCLKKAWNLQITRSFLRNNRYTPPGNWVEPSEIPLLNCQVPRLEKTNSIIYLSQESQQTKTQNGVLSHRGYQLIVLLPSVPKLSQAKVLIRLRRRKIYFSRLF